VLDWVALSHGRLFDAVFYFAEADSGAVFPKKRGFELGLLRPAELQGLGELGSDAASQPSLRDVGKLAMGRIGGAGGRLLTD
jgi:hypothetical protein